MTRGLRGEVALASHNLSEPDISHWAIHPGGPRIIDVVGQQLGLTDDQVAIDPRTRT